MHRSPLVEKGSVLVAKPGYWSLNCPCFHKVLGGSGVQGEGFGAYEVVSL